MGMPAAATARSVLRTVIDGCVVEVLAIKEIDDCTAGRKKQSYGEEKKQSNFH